MFLIHQDGVFDFDLGFLEELLALIDSQLDKLAAEAKISSDPDSFGIYDRSEAVTGLGFVACQQYMTSTRPHFDTKDRLSALRSGPKLAHSETYVAELINAAANFWKHHDEWAIKGNKPNEKTIDVIESTGLSIRTDHLLNNILCRIVHEQPYRLRSVIPLLVSWRDQLIRQRKTG